MDPRYIGYGYVRWIKFPRSRKFCGGGFNLFRSGAISVTVMVGFVTVENYLYKINKKNKCLKAITRQLYTYDICCP
jgi:hypothetical protein